MEEMGSIRLWPIFWRHFLADYTAASESRDEDEDSDAVSESLDYDDDFWYDDGYNFGSPPADQADMALIRTASIGSEQVGQQCAVCQEEFMEGESADRLPCQHHFHSECIRDWLEKCGSCPLCRQPLSSTVEVEDKSDERDNLLGDSNSTLFASTVFQMRQSISMLSWYSFTRIDRSPIILPFESNLLLLHRSFGSYHSLISHEQDEQTPSTKFEESERQKRLSGEAISTGNFKGPTASAKPVSKLSNLCRPLRRGSRRSVGSQGQMLSGCAWQIASI